MSYNEQLRCDNLTTNHEGAVAWRMTPEWELYTTVVTTMGFEDKFYENGEDRVWRIADLVRKVQPEFVVQLAVYAREVMYLRSVPLLLLVELDQCCQDDTLVSRAISRTVQRADEITELLMCYLWRTGKKDLKSLSSQLRKGLAEAFNHFDKYQFAKYNRKNRKVTLRDALLLVKPEPKDDAQAEIFQKIQSDTLETPYTWETELSAVGQRHFVSEKEKDEAKREVWRQLVKSRRMGYMATLRNLRNMLLLGMDQETMKMVCDFISDPEAARRSKQMPFRFLSAYLELTAERRVGIDKSRYNQLRMELKQLRKDIRLIGDSVDKMRHGYFLKTVRVVKRFYAEKPRSISNLVDVYKDLGYRPPMRHYRCKIQKWRHFDHLSDKMVRLLEKQEEQLFKLLQREKTLNNQLAHEYNLIEKEQNSLKEQEEMRKHILSNGLPFEVLQSLEEAAFWTADNIPGFDERTRVLLASDVSGSMLRPVSRNSSVRCLHIGILLSMLMYCRCVNAVTGVFGTNWKKYPFSSVNILQNTAGFISSLMSNSIAHEIGWTTNGYKVIDWLIAEECVIDKVMFFTDCQLWDSQEHDYSLAGSWNRYKKIAPNAKLYLFDLAGYGQSPFSMKRDDVFCIAGWSDKVFDILAALERGNNAIDEIRRIVV